MEILGLMLIVLVCVGAVVVSVRGITAVIDCIMKDLSDD